MFNPEVMMDEAHYRLIEGYAYALKPDFILELGMGSAELTNRLLKIIDYNARGELDVVDNWYDWRGIRPDHVPEHKQLTIHEMDEKEFVTGMIGRWDLIISDGDHYHTHEYVDRLLNSLTHTGVAFFHDVLNSDFVNLWEIVMYVMRNNRKFSYKIFDTTSRDNERCERGLLLVQRA
jgi:spermidine synthase